MATRAKKGWLDLMLGTKPRGRKAEAQKAHDEQAVAAMRQRLATRLPGDGLVVGMTRAADGSFTETRMTPRQAGSVRSRRSAHCHCRARAPAMTARGCHQRPERSSKTHPPTNRRTSLDPDPSR